MSCWRPNPSALHRPTTINNRRNSNSSKNAPNQSENPPHACIKLGLDFHAVWIAVVHIIDGTAQDWNLGRRFNGNCWTVGNCTSYESALRSPRREHGQPNRPKSHHRARLLARCPKSGPRDAGGILTSPKPHGSYPIWGQALFTQQLSPPCLRRPQPDHAS